MALQLGATREAFLSAGVPADKANAAAEELATFDSRFASMENSITRLAGDMATLKWMVGFCLALNVAILLRLFVHA